MPEVTDIQLLRLYDCAISSRMGMPDQGFPKTMLVLEGLGYVKKKDKGYVVTTEGLAILKINNEKLFGKKKREKKSKIKEYEDTSEDFYE